MMVINEKRVFFRFSMILIIILILGSFCLAGENPPLPRLEKPIFVTSCGQSPDYGVVDLLGRRSAGLEIIANPTAEPDDIGGFKTLIIVIGGSGKGLGAAGIDVPEELKRVEELIKKAKEEGIFILGMHLGGADRRGPVSEQFVPFATKVDYLIVREDGNKDGYFTKVAEELKIPLFLIIKNVELVEILKEIFEDGKTE